MSGTVYSKFFWQDWHGDDELALCSLPARGLWMSLLCLAARAHPVGHVLVKGKVPTRDEIKHLCRLKETPEEIGTLIDELRDAGVCDVDERSSALLSRRMIRDAKRRESAVKGGKKRQRQVIEDKQEKGAAQGVNISRPEKNHISPPVQPPSTRVQSPSSINHQPISREESSALPKSSETEKDDFDSRMAKIRVIGRLLGYDPELNAYDGAKWNTQLATMERDGVTYEDLLATVKAKVEAGLVPAGLDTLNYFRRAATETRDARLFAERAKGSTAEGDKAQTLKVVPATAPDLTFAEWRAHMQTMLDCGLWQPRICGPAPWEPGCMAPPALLTAARAIWEKQGNHPKYVHLGNGTTPWEEVTDPYDRKQAVNTFGWMPKPFHGMGNASANPTMCASGAKP